MKYSNIVESYRAMYDSNLDELYKGRHGQSETEYQDSRSDAGKRISGDSKSGPVAYSRRNVAKDAPTPAGAKPKHTPKLANWEKDNMKIRKNSLRKEDLDCLEIILSHLLDEGYANDIDGAGAILLNMSESWMNDILISEERFPLSPEKKRMARSIGLGADELEKAIKNVTLKRKEEPNKKQRKITRQTWVDNSKASDQGRTRISRR